MTFVGGGRLRIEGQAIRDGSVGFVRLKAPGFLPIIVPPNTLRAAEDGVLRVEMTRRGRIEGRVSFRGGKPAPGAEVKLLATGNPLQPELATAHADETGNFVLENVAPGLTGGRIVAEAGEGSEKRSTVVDLVDPPAPGRTSWVDLDLCRRR